MPRVIVTTDPALLSDDAPVLLDERVSSVHLSTGHAAGSPSPAAKLSMRARHSFSLFSTMGLDFPSRH